MDINNKDIIFLGIAKHFKQEGPPYPIGETNIIGLSKQLVHIFYPTSLRPFTILVLINSKLIAEGVVKILNIEIKDDSDQMVANFNISSEGPAQAVNFADLKDIQGGGAQGVLFNEESELALLPLSVDGVISRPGKYRLTVGWDATPKTVFDTVYFHYQKVLPFTEEQIKAIQSNPHSIKKGIIEIGCKNCPEKFKVYTSLNRDTSLESKGIIWQHDVPNEFVCKCGKTKIDLKYIKESFHGLLLKDRASSYGNVNIVRAYAHEEVVKVISTFKEILQTAKSEIDLQEFIEKHLLMLAKYHAKRIYNRRNILGKFVTDFIIHDSMKQLILVEIEPADLQLFKKGTGHPTQRLMQPYNQVNDWLNEISKHFTAVLDSLEIDSKEVSSIKGVVIAGRSIKEEAKDLLKHRAHPPYPNIEFLTYDELADSVFQISKDLA